MAGSAGRGQETPTAAKMTDPAQSRQGYRHDIQDVPAPPSMTALPIAGDDATSRDRDTVVEVTRLEPVARVVSPAGAVEHEFILVGTGIEKIATKRGHLDGSPRRGAVTALGRQPLGRQQSSILVIPGGRGCHPLYRRPTGAQTGLVPSRRDDQGRRPLAIYRRPSGAKRSPVTSLWTCIVLTSSTPELPTTTVSRVSAGDGVAGGRPGPEHDLGGPGGFEGRAANDPQNPLVVAFVQHQGLRG